METTDYIWEVGQTKLVIPNGMTEKVKGVILNIQEDRGEGHTKFLYIEYTDPRDNCTYRGWFNDQTNKRVYANEWRGR